MPPVRPQQQQQQEKKPGGESGAVAGEELGLENGGPKLTGGKLRVVGSSKRTLDNEPLFLL